MLYPLLLILHLLAALFFIATVVFEVLILYPLRRGLPGPAADTLQRQVTDRVRGYVHWAALVLYGAGLGLAWHHRAALSHPLASGFGMLLSLKILLALSILGHFGGLVVMLKRGSLTPRRHRLLYLSLFVHVLLIVILAKSMYYAPLLF